MRAGENDGLRVLALATLGPLADSLAREALDSAVVEVEPDVLAWTGSGGDVHAHRVILWLPPDLHARVSAAPAVVDALTSAMAAVVARSSGNALADLELRSRPGHGPRGTPYRG